MPQSPLQGCGTSIHYLMLANVSASVCPQLTHTVVTQAAVGGSRRPEHLAGEAVLELHHLLVDDDFPGARGRSIAGVSSGVYGTGWHSDTKRAKVTSPIN